MIIATYMKLYLLHVPLLASYFPVSEMTYTVSSGTLTILYYTIASYLLINWQCNEWQWCHAVPC